MKRMIAFLLAVCVIVGLVACGKKINDPVKLPSNITVHTSPTAVPVSTEDTESTASYDETVHSKATVATDFPTEATANLTTETIPAATSVTMATGATQATILTEATVATKPDAAKSPHKGKTIEIYGLGSETSYTDYSQYDETYIWMMRAAVVEWAEINGVTLIFSGDYDQSKILAAVDAGSCPDIVFYTDKFPTIANVEIVASFTDAEYKKLADICGSGYLEMLNYRTKSYGFVLPWAGNTMCYYNKTMFDNYNVKTPKEYFMEGEWNWESFQKCMEEMTRDVNGDGKIDTYGLPGDSLTWCRMVNPFTTDDTGKLINTIDDPMIQAFFQFKYDVFNVKKCAVPAKNEIYTNVAFPMFAMQLSDCEPYNLENLYQTIPNSDELEVVPVPAYEDRNIVQWKQACVSLASTCDERAAAVDMLSYLLKCGMKYMSDCSLGAVKCDYEGLQGFSAVSAEFVDAFSKICERRTEKIKKTSNYDAELISKIYESFQSAEWYTYQVYPGVKLLTSYREITQMRPESAIPVVQPKYEAEIKKYNDMYNSKS